MVILVLGVWLCAVGFCGAGLFFFLGLRLTSRVSIIFIALPLTPPDTIYYTHNVRNCQVFFAKKIKKDGGF